MSDPTGYEPAKIWTMAGDNGGITQPDKTSSSYKKSQASLCHLCK